MLQEGGLHGVPRDLVLLLIRKLAFAFQFGRDDERFSVLTGAITNELAAPGTCSFGVSGALLCGSHACYPCCSLAVLPHSRGQCRQLEASYSGSVGPCISTHLSPVHSVSLLFFFFFFLLSSFVFWSKEQTFMLIDSS